MTEPGPEAKVRFSRRRMVFPPRIATILALLPLLAVRAATAEESVFLRADDLATLGGQSVEANYALESGRSFGDPNEAEFGFRHRLQVAYGITDWLQASVEQSIKHFLDSDEVKVGVFAPEVRLTLGALLPDSVGAWPVDVSAYFAPRIRVTGRRNPSLVFGFGTNSKGTGLQLTANVGVEVTVPEPGGTAPVNVGPRYDFGIGYSVGGGFVIAAEAWGHAAWISSGFLEQEHHVGPSVLFLVGPVRTGFNLAVGLRERAGQSIFSDLAGMFTLGFRL